MNTGSSRAPLAREVNSNIKWAARMAQSLGTGVPWVMCKQIDAPYDIFFGGTNFRLTAAGPLQISSYDYDAPIDEYGMSNNNSKICSFRWHRGIHTAVEIVDDIQLMNRACLGLLSEPKWGHLKDLHAALKLSKPALVAANSATCIKLGPKQEIGAQTSVKLLEFDLPLVSSLFPSQKLINQDGISHSSSSWVTAEDPTHVWCNSNFTVQAPCLFQVKVTLLVIGSKWSRQFNSLLSQTVGLQNYGAFLEKDGGGIRGTIKLTGFENGDIDLSKSFWTYQGHVYQSDIHPNRVNMSYSGFSSICSAFVANIDEKKTTTVTFPGYIYCTTMVCIKRSA
ncbi:hypothetical protein PIB30_003796 [Stylosanthes scabra]|uniref:beta-galactosidase n=1 Tax=Stylosanthes scabra TaxID=79078 RepID=A0ABU6S2Y5_9FABA|nr:hypothetical protein [Stylosanthes scabra]